MRKSIRTTSGRRVAHNCRASAPSTASPTSSKVVFGFEDQAQALADDEVVVGD
jgi:hypothetical protein